jgi:hypothetical protein
MCESCAHRQNLVDRVPDSIWVVFKGCHLCIPKCSMRENLLKEKYSGGIAGHFGNEKRFSQLKNSYYWLGMREDVNNFLNICNIFQYAKGRKKILGCINHFLF